MLEYAYSDNRIDLQYVQMQTEHGSMLHSSPWNSQPNKRRKGVVPQPEGRLRHNEKGVGATHGVYSSTYYVHYNTLLP